jgi:ribosomal protein L11 methyltransferase
VEKLSAEQHPKHIAMSTERLEDAEHPLEAATREALATGDLTDVFTELLGAKRPVVKLVEMQCPVGLPAQSMSDALMEAGALYVNVSDGSAGTVDEHPIFAAHDPETTLPRVETWSDFLEAGALWSNSTFEIGFDPKADVEGALLMAGATFGLSALPRYTISDVETRDWVTEVQANWPPIVLPGCLTIRFPWHTDSDVKAVSAEQDPAGMDQQVELTLHPGMASGTGEHATTQLCLSALKRILALPSALRGGTILQYGSGSGVLAFGALHFGASRGVGVEIDPEALKSSQKNAVTNDLAREFDAFLPEEESQLERTYDIVVANILAGTLIELAPLLTNRVSPGGKLLLSGIWGGKQAAQVVDAFSRLGQNGIAPFEHFDIEYRNGWAFVEALRT